MNVISFKKPTNISLGLFSFLLAMSLSSTTLQAQEDGEKLFKSYCASCHSPGANQLVGPGLAGVYDKYQREWLYKWIKNSSALIATGDAQAISVYEQYNKVIMPAQPVTNVQIDAILDYLKVYAEATPVVPVVVPPTVVVEDEGMSGYAIAGIVVLFLILIILLRKVQYIFTAAKAREAGEDMPEETTMTQALGLTISQNKTIFALMGIVCLALFAKGGWDSAFGVGVYQGYEPEQPIKFSHELHAGTNGIDCNYCHNSASYSKSAGIPSPNLCMNCHTYIQEGPQYGKEEIGKIYAALDFDPVTKTYGPNQKPIKWVKVHNLPDHVYFNHSQHVAIGKIACEKCHGPVETYTVGKQYAELTMGWCINCHRDSNIKVKDNEYYTKIHEELSKKYGVEELSIAQMGGLECGKCHY